jgi:hypothetical protein
MENQELDNELLNQKNGKSLRSLLENGYETNSIEYIKKGIELFKQDIGSFIGFILIVAVAQGIISSIPFVKGFASAVIAPILAGGFIVARKIDQKEARSFSNFFDGTNKYTPLAIVTLIPTVIIAAIFLVIGGWSYFKVAFLGIKPAFDINHFSGMNFSYSSLYGFAGRSGLAGLIAAVISVLFLFGTFLVLFENFEPVKALDISRKIIGKKFLNWVGFLFLIVLFNVAGAICLLVGLLVTIPSSICALYVAYEDVVGLNLRD